MESFVQELGSQKVLSKKDILLLKEYINKKYKNSSHIERTSILSKTVHQILDKNFQGLRDEDSKVIKSNLLKNTLLKDGKTIALLDIFNACILVKDKSKDTLENLLDWTNLHVENKVSKTDLEEYYLEHNSINNTVDTSINEIYIEVNAKPIDDYAENNFKEEVSLNNEDTINEIKKIILNFKFITWIEKFLGFKVVRYSLCFTLMVAILLFRNEYKINKDFINDSAYTSAQNQMKINNKTKGIGKIKYSTNLPEYFMYKDIDEVNLKKYLGDRDSILVEEPYFSTIISVSKEYDLNPLVIFAITGQEEGFVPKKDSDSVNIANNPFNVFHSWREYNTNIEDTSKIVCNTIINLSNDRPKDEEPFYWINRKYAEDKDWSKGVKKLYEELEKNNIKY